MSRGTGELIAEALEAGADRLLVGVGGSASTDGGLGALEVLEGRGGLGRAEVLVACDVVTLFLDAAREFAPQKGASVAQVAELAQRLSALAGYYSERFAVDVVAMPGSGAAGGLAGGLAALGAELVPGLDLVASRVGLDRRIAASGFVVTGEGRLDSSSWSGKVVGGVVRRGRRRCLSWCWPGAWAREGSRCRRVRQAPRWITAPEPARRRRRSSVVMGSWRS